MHRHTQTRSTRAHTPHTRQRALHLSKYPHAQMHPTSRKHPARTNIPHTRQCAPHVSKYLHRANAPRTRQSITRQRTRTRQRAPHASKYPARANTPHTHQSPPTRNHTPHASKRPTCANTPYTRQCALHATMQQRTRNAPTCERAFAPARANIFTLNMYFTSSISICTLLYLSIHETKEYIGRSRCGAAVHVPKKRDADEAGVSRKPQRRQGASYWAV
jgi:hypothetical protein